MATKETVAILPEDLLEVVLGRLPARSLVASQCVCKAWRDLVDERLMRRRPPPGERPLHQLRDAPPATLLRPAAGGCGRDVRVQPHHVAVDPPAPALRRAQLGPKEQCRRTYYKVLLEPKEPSKKNDVEENDDEDDRRRFMEWPPSPWTWQEFSSATGRWEMKVFVREGDAAGTDGDLLFESVIYGGIEPRWRYAAYWQGQLYVHCHGEYVSRYVMK
nr:unnamed protein product [Digitaria exilis]